MTKLKSKKMTKSTLAIIIMGIAIVALLAFGGTFAYFTATTNKKNTTFTTGVIKLKAGDVAVATVDKVVYGDQVLGAVSFDPTGTTVKSIAIIHMGITNSGNVNFDTLFGQNATSINNAWHRLYVDNGQYYLEEGDPEKTPSDYYYQIIDVAANGDITFTNAFMSALTISASPNNVETVSNGVSSFSEDSNGIMGQAITLQFAAAAIQYRGLYSSNTDETQLSDDIINAAVTSLSSNLAFAA